MFKNWLKIVVILSGGCVAMGAIAGQDFAMQMTVPTNEPTYATALAELQGEGLVTLKSQIGLVVDSHSQAVGMYYELPDAHSGSSMSELYGLGMLTTPAGVILSSYHGTPLIVLHGRINLQAASNVIEVSYLTSLVSKQYKQCRIYLEHDVKDNRWGLVNAYTNKPVTKMIVVAHGMGINTIKNVCPN